MLICFLVVDMPLLCLWARKDKHFYRKLSMDFIIFAPYFIKLLWQHSDKEL